ncbi:PREDICTED: leucine-rich repeat-containing protein 15-like isoform X2 [Dinoponera quadriceps]|nr:PREDICTED: leucine-rich repeat-containing protein 15-like isoform X2 [Dinoponera quadriceps]
MKLAFTLVILACWSKLSLASNTPESPDLGESQFLCESNLLSLNFSNAVITKIGQDFIGSQLITCLDLRKNQIEVIAPNAFSKLPKLKKLYLSNNKFSTARDIFTFGGHETLEILTANNAVRNAIYIDITIPGSYPNLEILFARENGFKDITATEKSPFPKLKILDLSGNRMTDTKFKNLLPSSLEHIYLNDNSFSTLKSLSKGSNVTTLILDNNRFTMIRDFSNNPNDIGLWLSAFHNLRHLSVAGNMISTIYSDFSGLNNLTYLNLSRNEISSLSSGAFQKLLQLETLDLSQNKIQEVIKMSSAINVTTLLLSCNKIQKVPANAFQQMPELRELSLKANLIEEVDVNSFAYLNYLETLDLSDNKLSSLPEGWTGAFNSLQILDLSENKFTSLESLSLSNTLPLVEVYLMANPLKYLDAGSFDNLPKNVTVDLAHRFHEGYPKC